MDERLKQRLVGAAVLVSLVVIIAPMILEQPPEPDGVWRASVIPPRPEDVFRTEIVPVREDEILDMPEAADVVGRAAPVRIRSRDGTGQRPGSGGRAATRAAPHETDRQSSPRALGAWAVQLGSFSNAANALALRDRLRAKGYPAFIEGVRVEDRDIKRVYVGPELLRAKAAESRKKLEQETELQGLVVRYPTG